MKIPGIIILELYFSYNNSEVQLAQYSIFECFDENTKFDINSFKDELEKLVGVDYDYDPISEETPYLEIKISDILKKPLEHGIFIKLQNHNKNIVKSSNILDFCYTDININEIKRIGKNIVYINK